MDHKHDEYKHNNNNNMNIFPYAQKRFVRIKES